MKKEPHRIDPLDQLQRSERMSRIRGKDTKIEMEVRRIIFRMGYRYRLHPRDLPGRPDIVFRKRKKIIFVNGCFWHQHQNCGYYRQPKTRQEFWLTKLAKNAARDAINFDLLQNAGWQVMVLWGCEIGKHIDLERKIKDFLGD